MEDINMIPLSKRFDVLKFLIENSRDENLRVECVKRIKNIGLQNSVVFQFLETLIICDSNEAVRRTAFESIILINTNKIVDTITYAILNESGNFLIDLIEFLQGINPLVCKQILKQKIQQIENKSPHLLLKNQRFDKLNLQKLKELLFNHQMHNSLENLYFHRHAVPIALDLYGIE